MPNSPDTSSASMKAITPRKASDLTYLPGGPDVIPESTIIAGRADLALTTARHDDPRPIVEQGAPFKIIGAQYQKKPDRRGFSGLEPDPDAAGPCRKRLLAVPPVNVHLGQCDAPDQRDRSGTGEHRPLCLRPDPADPGRDRREPRFHDERPLHHQPAGRGRRCPSCSTNYGFTIYNDTVVVTEEGSGREARHAGRAGSGPRGAAGT